MNKQTLTPLILAGLLFVSSSSNAKQQSRTSSLRVTMTCYTKKEFPHSRTSSGRYPIEWRTLAVSRDLDFLFKRRALVRLKLKSFPSVQITWVAEDRMAKRWRRRIDLFLPSKTCRKFGKRHGIITFKKKKKGGK